MRTPFRALVVVAIWPLVAAAQDPPQGQRVYVCGHSFHAMIAAPLGQIARGAGIEDHITAGRSFIGGSSVTQHWEAAEDTSQVKPTIRQGKVDVLTLSPNGMLLPDEGIAKFTDLLLEANPHGRVLVQASWAGMDGQRSATFRNADRDGADPGEVRKRAEPINRKLTKQVQELHVRYRDKTGRQVLFLVPVGEAVTSLRERVVQGKAPGVAKQSELFRDDLGHGKAPIAVLAAYCHYAIIYQRSPVGLPVPEELKRAGLGENTGPLNRVLQQVAWETVTREPLSGVAPSPTLAEAPHLEAELIFPLHGQHNHAPGIVECPNGDLFVSWYRGSGERTADDVAVYGAWRAKGEARWSEPFVLADTPGFPDCNTALFVDDRQQLWLFYPTILANSWESCLTNFKVTSKFAPPGAPRWDREGLILLKPEDFGERARQQLDERLKQREAPLSDQQRQGIDRMRERLADKLYQRLGWQPRCKPTQLPSGRLLLPLYSDTFSISIMAISDDRGQTWRASQPLLGFGNIQPTVLRRADGSLVAYMRENGRRKRVRVSESKDDGESWGSVGECDLPNPGSGLDGLRLANGNWMLVYNDTVTGRQRLAVSLSSDEGRTWQFTRHLEDQPQGSYHYPAVTQGKDGTLHVVYSYFVAAGQSMKHAAFNEAWVKAGDSR